MSFELIPRARIPDTRIPQLMQPCLSLSRFVSQSHYRAWWAVSKVLLSLNQTLSGSLWLSRPHSFTRAHSGSFWVSLAHPGFVSGFWLSQALIGSQGPCSARNIVVQVYPALVETWWEDFLPPISLEIFSYLKMHIFISLKSGNSVHLICYKSSSREYGAVGL